jgi:DNA-binding LacI/PurR family transcriptional regulator
VAELGYRPNYAARNLRTNRSETIGVLTVGPLNYGASTILGGLTESACRARFPLMITHLDVATEVQAARGEVRRALDSFLSSRVDGIVVSTPYLGTEDLLDHIWETVPVVMVSGRPRSTVDTTDVDSYRAGVGATRHLVELGHQRILHIAGPADRNEAHERTRGYHDTLVTAGLAPLPVVRGDWSAASGHVVGVAADPATFTAVFAGNDQMALGFMSAMRSRGLVAPDDYSIIGVDDMPDARYFAPPLSSMFMDFTALGATAFKMIHHRISTGERLDRHVIEPVLVVRESTAAVRDYGHY